MWRARLAWLWSKGLRFTAGLFVSLGFALLALSEGAASPQVEGLALSEADAQERVRFVDGKSEVAEVVSGDAEGVTLRLAGLPRPVTFRWWQIDPADAAPLRERFLGKPAPAAPGAITVPGARIRTVDGKTHEGVVVPASPPSELWLRTAEGTLVFRLEAIAGREPAAIEARRVYTSDELVEVLAGRLRPKTPEDYDRLGAELLRADLRERAVAAFRTADLLRHPEWPESEVARGLARLRDLIEDLAVRRGVFQAEERCLAGDYDAALGQIDALERSLAGDVLGQARRLRAQLAELRGRARDERIVDEWLRALETFLKGKAMDRSLPYDRARSWVEDRMPGELLDHVRARFNFSPDDPAARVAWDRRPEGAVSKHGYEEASWVVARPDAGSPADWWAAAPDPARYKLLKGLFAEKHLRVIRVESKSCGGCGGTGLRADAVCPSCAGLKSQRVLFYR